MAGVSAAGLLVLDHNPAFSQTSGTWSATTGGSWGTASNWTGSQIAGGASGTAQFTSSITGEQTVTLDGNRTIGSVRLGSGGSANVFSLQTGTSGLWSLDSGGQTLSFNPATGDLVVAVPEPSTFCMALAGLAWGGYLARRCRRRARHAPAYVIPTRGEQVAVTVLPPSGFTGLPHSMYATFLTRPTPPPPASDRDALETMPSGKEHS